MHELAVTDSILNIATRYAAAANATRITDLYLVIGQLATIVDDSVQFYWDIVSKDTPAEGAKLHFRRIPAELLCLNCDTHYPPGDEILACPECDSASVRIVAG